MSGRHWAQRIEIVASLSVILTLVFLILEVRGNTSTIERQIMLDQYVSVTDVFINNSDMAETFVKIKAVDGLEPLIQAFTDRYALSAEESVRWTRFLMLRWGGLRDEFDSYVASVRARCCESGSRPRPSAIGEIE